MSIIHRTPCVFEGQLIAACPLQMLPVGQNAPLYDAQDEQAVDARLKS